MIDLNTVVQAIAEENLKLFRTAAGIRIGGNCRDELAAAIQHHQAVLLPYISIAPEDSEQIAEQQAAANSDSIREMLQDFAAWIMEHHPWASAGAAQEHVDSRLANAVDSQVPATVAEAIAAAKSELDALDWACHILPSSMETEAKHAAENHPAPKQEPDCPF